ncbi:MAG: hypothetical protein ACKOC5_05225 [Chloroflexota bacterium]
MTRSMQAALLLLLAALLSACQPAQPAKISGAVRLQSAAGIVFPPAEVKLMDPSIDQNDPKAVIGLVKTDAQGRYEFADLKPGSYTLGITNHMPSGVQCEPPGYLQLPPWLVGAAYQNQADGSVLPVLMAVYDAPIVAEAGAELQFDFELPIRCAQ